MKPRVFILSVCLSFQQVHLQLHSKQTLFLAFIIWTFFHVPVGPNNDLLPILSVMTRQLQDPQDINYHYMIHKGGLFASKSGNVLLEDGKYNFPLQ